MGITGYVGEKCKVLQNLEATATIGTAVTASNDADSRWYLTEFPTDITADPGLIMETGLGADYRAVRAVTPGVETAAYSLTTKMRPSDTLGYWMLGLIGSDIASPVQQSDTAGYLHTFTFRQPGASMPSFTHCVDKQFKQVYYNGAQMTGMTFDFKPGQGVAAMCTANFMAWKENAHSGMGTPTYDHTLRAYSWRDFGVSIGDTSDYNVSPGTKVEAATINFDAQAVQFMGAGNSGSPREVVRGALKVSGTLDVIVDSTHNSDFCVKYKAGTIIDNLWFRLRGDVITQYNYYTWEMRLGAVMITACPEPIGSGVMRTTISWEHVGAAAAGTVTAAPVIRILNKRSATYNK